jgi:hypothetical protein
MKTILTITLIFLATCNVDVIPENTCGGNEADSCASKQFKYPPNESKKKNDKPKLEKPKIEYPETFEYTELFKKQGHEYREYVESFKPGQNTTEYYDFSLGEDELMSLKDHRMAIYPQKKFEHNVQGNFLHFYKTAYEKKLPVYFTTDSMLYAVNENVNFMLRLFYEEIFIHSFRKLLDTIIEYGETLKETPQGNYHRLMISYAQVFFGTSVELITEGFEKYKAPEEIDQAIKNNADLAKKYAPNEFYIMMKKRMMDTNMMLPTAFYRKSNKLSNVFRAIRWLQIVRFDIKEDLNAIWLLGKLLHDSDKQNMFQNVNHMISYLWGQDRESPNVLEIYKLGKELGFGDDLQLNPEQTEQLYKKIMAELPHYMPDLGFSTDYIVYSKEALDHMRYTRMHTSYVFTQQYNIEDWVINKLVDYRKDKNRFMIHPYEVTSCIHQPSIFKQFIFNRYEGKKSWQNEQLLPLRDEIDIRENFEKAKYTIKDSMKKDPSKWRNNLLNHYHLLLFRATRRIKISDDPLFKTPWYKEKMFNTAFAGFTHLKSDIDIVNRVISVGAGKEGNFPEVVLEPNYEFYNELYLFFSAFKEQLMQYLVMSEPYLKLNYKLIKAIYKRHSEDMTYAIQLCQKLAPLQNKGKLTDEQKEELKQLIYYNADASAYDGWYYRLFSKGDEKDKYYFSYNVYITRVQTALPVDRFSFAGAMIYAGTKFPDIGVLVKQDPHEKKEKLLLYSAYSGFEFIKRFTEKVTFEDIRASVMKREY